MSDGDDWQFSDTADLPPVADLRMTTDQAWRLLTNNLDERHGAPIAAGDDEITEVLLRTRAIIGEPK